MKPSSSAPAWDICASQTWCTDLYRSRYRLDGNLDRAFGTPQVPVLEVSQKPGYGQPNKIAAALAVDPNGRIVVAANDESKVVLARFAPDGSPDATFGAGGRAITSFAGRPAVTNVAVKSNGEVVVAGQPAERRTPGDRDLWERRHRGRCFVTSFRPNRELDRRYGKRGVAFVPVLAVRDKTVRSEIGGAGSRSPAKSSRARPLPLGRAAR